MLAGPRYGSIWVVIRNTIGWIVGGPIWVQYLEEWLQICSIVFKRYMNQAETAILHTQRPRQRVTVVVEMNGERGDVQCMQSCLHTITLEVNVLTT